MNKEVQDKLVEIVGTYGSSVAEDPKLCEALLRDHCPGRKVEISVLTSAVQEGIPEQLRNPSAGTPLAVLRSKLIKHLEKNLAITEEAAQWAVECWAQAVVAMPVKSESSNCPPLRKEQNNERSRRSTETFVQQVKRIVTDSPGKIPAQNKEGDTLLHFAARRGEVEAIEILIEAKVPLNVRNKRGETALHAAITAGHGQAGQVLIRAGADLNIKTEDGRTPLHEAAAKKQRRLVELLLKQGVNTGLRTAQGKTALDLAREGEYSADTSSIVGLLAKEVAFARPSSSEEMGGPSASGATHRVTEIKEDNPPTPKATLRIFRSPLVRTVCMIGLGVSLVMICLAILVYARAYLLSSTRDAFMASLSSEDLKALNQGQVQDVRIPDVSHSSAEYRAGVQAFHSGDYTKAFEKFRPLAEKGDAEAQYLLGAMYGSGLGVKKDNAKAYRWYNEAADQGHAKAQHSIGSMYYFGEGVPRDHVDAAEWYFKAAKQGQAVSQYKLGLMYHLGQGVLKDYQEALRWYWKAAKQGYARAQHNLGSMYDSGEGVTQDYEEAAKWYRKAAMQGYAQAQLRLGKMFFEDKIVTNDYEEGASWIVKAAKKGLPEAQYTIGVMYFRGEGVAQDDKKAFQWLSRAGAQGHSRAQRVLARRQRSLEEDVAEY